MDPILLLLFLAIPAMLFFGMRKQKRAVQQQQELQDSIEVGDRVMTTSGMYGTVTDASDDTTIDLEIADGIVTTWLRQAVREKVGPVEYDDEDETDLDYADDDVAAAPDSDDTESDERREASDSGATVAPPLEHGR